MSVNHDCKQEHQIMAIDERSNRIDKEVYIGREGRQPLLVRVDRCERVVDKLCYVSTALLISVILAAGTVIWRSVTLTDQLSKAASKIKESARQTVSAWPYEPNDKN